MAPHASRCTIYWKGPHPAVQEARQLPGWGRFHRECGRHGLFYDSIEPAGRGRFEAITVRLEKRRDFYLRYRVSDGTGASPVDAVRAAFRNARGSGWAIPETTLELLDAPAPRTPPASTMPVADVSALLGVELTLEDLIG